MDKILTSRERIRNTLERKTVDRMPIDIGGSVVTGIHVDEYLAIARYVGIDVEVPKVFDQQLMLARFDEPMRRRFYSDVYMLENPTETWELRNRDWKTWNTSKQNSVLMPGDFNLFDGEKGYLYLKNKAGKRIAYKSKESLYFDKYLKDSIPTSDDWMTPEEWKKEIPLYTDEELDQLSRNAEFIYKYTDYSVHGNFGKGKLFTTGLFAGHLLEDWLCLLLTEQDYCFSILSATADRVQENLALYLQAVGKYIDTILVSTSDYGSQRSELFNPEIFRQLYAPNMKKINDFIHENCQAKVMYHSCGSIRKILDYMINTGVDIINPVQTSADHMEATELKQEFGDRIIFWGGGVDTQTVLQFDTPEKVKEHVQEKIQIFNENGGYVFAPIHNIQYGAPPENVIAMIDAAISCR